jgi:hypothetical protein
MRNLEKCPECLQRFHVEWQGKSSQKGISLILNRLIPRRVRQQFGEQKVRTTRTPSVTRPSSATAETR